MVAYTGDENRLRYNLPPIIQKDKNTKKWRFYFRYHMNGSKINAPTKANVTDDQALTMAAENIFQELTIQNENAVQEDAQQNHPNQ